MFSDCFSSFSMPIAYRNKNKKQKQKTKKKQNENKNKNKMGLELDIFHLIENHCRGLVHIFENIIVCCSVKTAWNVNAYYKGVLTNDIF